MARHLLEPDWDWAHWERQLCPARSLVTLSSYPFFFLALIQRVTDSLCKLSKLNKPQTSICERLNDRGPIHSLPFFDLARRGFYFTLAVFGTVVILLSLRLLVIFPRPWHGFLAQADWSLPDCYRSSILQPLAKRDQILGAP
jgi:hypothetical protein